MSKFEVFRDRIFKKNILLCMSLGLCPALAITTSLENALGMSAVVAAVTLASCVTVAAMRNFLNSGSRPVSITLVISGYACAAAMFTHMLAPKLYDSLGVYLLITETSCMIHECAESAAEGDGIGFAAVDSIGAGIGYAIALCLAAAVREIFGGGSIYGVEIPILSRFKVDFFVTAPGALFVFGLLCAVQKKLALGRKEVNANA